MAKYQFLTTWCIDAPIGAVFDVLNDSPGYPRWWKGVVSAEVLEAGADIGDITARDNRGLSFRASIGGCLLARVPRWRALARGALGHG